MENCDFDTRYPILLVHGTGFRDRKIINYWGRIPKTLIGGGACIFYGGQDAWGTIENNAQTLADKLDSILLEVGAKTTNIEYNANGGEKTHIMPSENCAGTAKKTTSGADGGENTQITPNENGAGTAKNTTYSANGSENTHFTSCGNGVGKVNIIAHSKGGLESRYLISSLGYSGKVASLTTISTPHHGALIMDWAMRFPAFLVRFVGFFVNLWFRILGDKKPDFYTVCKSFTTQSAAEFNAKNPDCAGIYYQSYAGAMKNSRSDMSMWLFHKIIKRRGGENDGIVATEAAKWGEFKGVIRGQDGRGVSHGDEIDLRRRNFKRKPKETQSGHYNDIRELYKQIVKDLKSRGF